MIRPYKYKHIIFEVLQATYSREPELNWYSAKRKGGYSNEVNNDLTVDILALMVSVMSMSPGEYMYPYYQETLRQEVQNLIWMVWSGGTTAETCTNNIFTALELDEKF